MEAHTGTITIRTGKILEPRRNRFAEVMTAIRRRRSARAERAYSLRANAPRVTSLPGSDHTHLIRRPRGF